MTVFKENKLYRLRKQVAIRRAARPIDECRITDLSPRTKVVYLGTETWHGVSFLKLEHNIDTIWVYLGSSTPQEVLCEIPSPDTEPIMPGSMVELNVYRKFYKDKYMQDGKCTPGALNPGEIMMFVREEEVQWLNQPARFSSMIRVLYKDVAGWFPKNFTSDEDNELYELFTLVKEPDDEKPQL